MMRQIQNIGHRILTRITKIGMLKVFRHIWTMLAIFLVIMAIVFTLFRAMTPWVKQYRSQIQQQLSVWTGKKITIHDIETSWYWMTPVLRLNQVAISDTQGHVLHFNRVMVGVNIFGSLLHWQIQPGVLYIDEAHFKLQQRDDAWHLEDFDLPTASSAVSTESNALAFFGMLLTQEKLVIKRVSADITLQDGTQIPLRNFLIKAEHHAQHYRIYSKATLAGQLGTQMMVIANLTLEGNDFSKSSGQVYVSLSNGDLRLTQKLYPEIPVQIKHGIGSMDAWLEMRRGQIKQAQSVVELRDMAIIEPSRTAPRKLPTVTGNLAWQRLSHGWRITCDQFLFDLDGIEWPENAFMFEYRELTSDYHAYIKALPFRQLLLTDLPWPKLMQPWLRLKPKGELHDTELSWQNGQLRDLLTRFSHLSWRAKGEIPGLTELSGVLYWQPTEGRLELDSEHTVLSLHKPLVPIVLDTLNASLDWKELSQGLRLSLDRLVLSHPNLVLSASGALDDPLGAAAHLRLQMDFAAKAAQFWLPYIPGKGLKPKLDYWLKHGIPRIAHASGHLKIAGPLADFPFDNHTGDFSIQSHVNGVDILINEDWPMNADINADIRVKGRTLSAEIDRANLAGVAVHQVNLSVPDIGLGKEVFLLHGAVKAPGDQIKAYVFASPLRQRFTRWRGMTIEDPLGLDLNLEVPLYPESDHVFATGHLDFAQNTVAVDVGDKPAMFTDVTGRLAFNEYGLTSGGLDGTLDAYPFTLRVQPLLEPKAATELRFEGELAIDYLQNLLHHPAFSLLQGQLIVTGLWTVYPENTQNDKLCINSSLVGMAVNLPKPLGKSLTEIAPLTINIDFLPKHRMDFDLKYAERLIGRFTMKQTSKNNWTTNGDLHLGAGTVQPNQSGLRISGTLADVNVNEWQKIWKKWPKTSNSASLLDSLHDVDIAIDKVVYSGMTYDQVKLKAHQMTPKQWSFNLLQKELSGDFTYNWAKDTLSGHVNTLNLDVLQPSSKTPWKPNIETIPNLDLSIDQITYKGTDLGKLDLNSSSHPGHWILNGCTIRTPEYQLSVQGDWIIDDNKKSTSKIEAQFHLDNLAKMFERWHLTPAVHAHYGQIDFKGKWPGTFYNFSLKNLTGDMNLVVKDGRISHLDRETEAKLGLGKLLSILSLQTIPRRLKLDFSDLAHQGYTFDVFKGTFVIDKGVMTTKDSFIDGPVAHGTMTGDLDLINQLYDLDLKMSPYITTSLPVVATITGGPVAGLATWALSSLASKGMQKISGYTYKISGPWLKPVVQQVGIDKTNH